jgi:hypoxanthine phosphoribosyltransferase
MVVRKIMFYENPFIESQVEKDSDFEFLADPEVREGLKIRIKEIIELCLEKKIGAVVFVDKSARPFAWLFHDVWDRLHPDIPRPEIRFINIGKQSLVNKGAEKRLLGEVSDEPWFIRGDIEEKIGKMDLSKDTLSINDVPEMWQENVMNSVDELEELEGVFKNSFDDKKVLIVDDYIYTGRSLLASIASLSAAFPKASFEGTAAFKSKGMGYAVDRKKVPWLAVPSMSGVLELPESELISARVTQEEIDKVRQSLEDKLTVKMSEALKWMEGFEDVKLAYVDLLTKYKDQIDSNTYEQILEILEMMSREVRKIQTSRSIEDFDKEQFEKEQLKLWELTQKVKQQLAPKDLRLLTDASSDLSCRIPTSNFDFLDACEIQFLLKDYTTVKEMLRNARTLRKELRDLAKEID